MRKNVRTRRKAHAKTIISTKMTMVCNFYIILHPSGVLNLITYHTMLDEELLDLLV